MRRDAPGVVLAGKYELLEKAGAGGMAVVWRARTLGAAGFSRPVAVKRVSPHLATDPRFATMFVEEARVVSRLGHPLINQIHDFGVDEEGHHFLVMEWVEGVDLNELAQSYYGANARVPWSLATAIAIDVLDALGAAHAHVAADGTPAPVFHRDVTPQNIRISIDGFAKLTDFGIARAMDRATMTTPNAIKGKISYVAPEQVRAKPATVQSDIFSVGVCLWETLAGRRLFDAPSDMQVVFLVEEAKIPDLRAIRGDVPEGLWAAVRAALARDPAERPSSALALSRSLGEVLRTGNETADRSSIADIVRHVRRHLDRGAESP